MGVLERYSLFIAGKEIALLTNDINALNKETKIIQSMYDSIINQYENKLDRESVFLFMIFNILHDKQFNLGELQEEIHLIESLSGDISLYLN